ncbi:MAG TPA: VWA domain-containing protein, partial [Thermoanaerobaculia bacterium]|nr:VWA domain-containing protein [Thermoanaerobaculia bacterium]
GGIAFRRMPLPLSMKHLAIVISLLALAVPGWAQQFEEKIDVNAVLLDVIVTDNKGNQILGLTKDDFVVKENGVAQEVDSVDYFTNRQLLDAREQDAPFKVEKVREDRYFVFFFDKPEDPGVLFDQLSQARRAVREFVREDMKPTDYVAIAGHDVRLKVWSDFTNDKAKLERALEDSARFGKGESQAQGEGPSILRGLDQSLLDKRTGSVYEALDVLAEAVRPIRARKNLVLFSPGIVDIGETVRAGMIVNRSRYLDPALRSLNAANVSVYSVQLQRPTDTEVSTTPLFHQRLTELASETGGEYFMSGASFKPTVKRVEKTNAGYYLVTYRSQKPRGEKGFQKVDVSLKNPEFRIVARSGYEFGS